MSQWTGLVSVQKWFIAYSSSHYLNQCQGIVNWTLRNKLQWNINQNTKLCIHENACKMSSAKWWPCCLGPNVLEMLYVGSASLGHYNDVIMSAMASQFTGVSIVCSIVGSCPDQRKHQSSASLAFVREFTDDRKFPHKGPVTREMFPFDDVIMVKADLPVSATHHVFHIFDQEHLSYAKHACRGLSVGYVAPLVDQPHSQQSEPCAWAYWMSCWLAWRESRLWHAASASVAFRLYIDLLCP